MNPHSPDMKTSKPKSKPAGTKKVPQRAPAGKTKPTSSADTERKTKLKKLAPNAPAARVSLFAKAYATNGCNGTAAMIAAGYSEHTAREQATRFLKRPEVIEAVQQELQLRRQKMELSSERILLELSRIAYFDPRKLFNDDGSPKPISELDDDTAAALAGLKIKEVYEGAGKDRRFVGYEKDYKVFDKNSAIDKAMRHLGLLKDKVELTGANGGPLTINGELNMVIAARRIAFAMAKGMKLAQQSSTPLSNDK